MKEKIFKSIDCSLPGEISPNFFLARLASHQFQLNRKIAKKLMFQKFEISCDSSVSSCNFLVIRTHEMFRSDITLYYLFHLLTKTRDEFFVTLTIIVNSISIRFRPINIIYLIQFKQHSKSSLNL